MVDDELKS